MIFTTRQINIESIVTEKLEFLIPVYQRPYVWDDTEIKKLLEDLKHNFEINSEGNYFVGNTYVIKSFKDNKAQQYEVIDGQQRFTTFWLISLCFNTLGINTGLKNYLEIEYEKHKDIRFDFDIRKEVYEYLKGLLDGTAERRFHDVSNLEFLKNISIGIKTIIGFLESIRENKNEENFEKINLERFGDFIYYNVKFVFNEAPENTDLNSLFVALGTSGIQLQQSDILKARLLDKITDKNQRVIYAKVWEACENMNNYFESNVKHSFPYDTSKVVETDFKEFNQEKFKVSIEIDDNKNSGTTIQEIIEMNEIHYVDENTGKEINTDCRSIVSFNVFLFHVLRIYRNNNYISTDVSEKNDIDSLDPKKLLDSFKIDEIKNVPEFIELMWKVRYLFDKYVVKWLKDEDEGFDDEEKLLLSSINTSKNEDKSYFSRNEKEFSNLQMLQSVLYFTGIFTQQYWLTPFLNFLLENENVAKDLDFNGIILNELERIDNIMIPGDKKEMSWQILINNAALPKFDLNENDLLKSSGVRFNHYWFYKLEYLLWKNWQNRNDDKFKRYRITSKNSVEHVFPQNEENSFKLDDKDTLDSFGNLTLLSVGQNSQYSNQSVEKKKIDFKMKQTYDSLKLAKIYLEFENWSAKEIKEHQKKMLIILEKHYNFNFS